MLAQKQYAKKRHRVLTKRIPIVQIWFPANARRTTTLANYQKNALENAWTKHFSLIRLSINWKSHTKKGNGKNIFFEKLFQPVWKTMHQKTRAKFRVKKNLWLQCQIGKFGSSQIVCVKMPEQQMYNIEKTSSGRKTKKKGQSKVDKPKYSQTR